MPRPRSDIDQRIVRAACKRFLKDGVDGASLRRIAREARTNIGMVYYYFPTKDELFLAVVEEVYVNFLEDLAKALAPDVSVRERLVRMSMRLGSATEHELTIMRLVAREALTSSSRRDRLIERFTRGHIALIARTISDGILDGSFDQRYHPFLLMAATASVAGVPQIMRRIIGDRLPFTDAPSGAELSQALVDVLFQGIARQSS